MRPGNWRTEQGTGVVIAEFGEWLYQSAGIKLTILYDPWDRGRFLWGVWTTISLSVICVTASVLIGMVPMPGDQKDPADLERALKKTTAMCIEAGREFNRGQRAFFLAIGYLGWFFGDFFFILSVLCVFAIMISRQFFSPAHHAVD